MHDWEVEVDKKAEVFEANGLVVHLWKDNELFGTVDVRDKSIHYAKDVCENWESGLLKEDNEYILRSTLD